jgi:O-antigen/teichoic acid export membrane protein
LLYRSKDYAGHGDTITVLALGVLVTAVGMPTFAALICLERPREVFWTGLFGAVLSVVLVACLVGRWGLLGAAYGLLAGNVGRWGGRWVLFLALVRRRQQTPSPKRIRSSSLDPLKESSIASVERLD